MQLSSTERTLIEGSYDEGRAEGLAEGRAEGRAEGILAVARKMLARGISKEMVAEMTGLPTEQLRGLSAES